MGVHIPIVVGVSIPMDRIVYKEGACSDLNILPFSKIRDI